MKSFVIHRDFKQKSDNIRVIILNKERNQWITKQIK